MAFIDAIVSEGRQWADDLRTSAASTCSIYRDGGLGAQDPTTGIQQRVWRKVYSGLPMRLSGTNRGSATHRAVTVPGGEVEVPVRVASFSVSTTDLEAGDLIEITDGDNAGLVLSIAEASWQDQSTARRVPVIGARRPDEWDHDDLGEES